MRPTGACSTAAVSVAFVVVVVVVAILLVVLLVLFLLLVVVVLLINASIFGRSIHLMMAASSFHCMHA